MSARKCRNCREVCDDSRSLAANGPGRFPHIFEWGRIQSNSDWILPVGVCLAIMLFVRYMYRRDAVELPMFLGWILTVLRTAAFLGLLIMFCSLIGDRNAKCSATPKRYC